MIGWISESGTHRVLLIRGRRIDFRILGQDVTLFREKDAYYIRVPQHIRFLEGGEIVHQKRQVLKDETTGAAAEICYSIYDNGYGRFQKYEWKEDILTIGSGIDDDFYLQDESIAPHQFVLERSSGQIFEIGEHPIGELDGLDTGEHRKFHNGSRFRVLNLQMVLHEDFLMVNCVENLYVSLPSFRRKEEILPETMENEHVSRNYRNVNLSLRYEEVLEEPLPYESRERNPLVFMMGPALTMSSASMMTGMIAAYNGWLNGREWIELLPSVMLPFVMVISTLLWNPLQRLYEKRKEKKKMRQRIQDYEKYLGLLRNEILEFRQQVTETYERLFPLECRSGENVYRCLPEHQDYLAVRLGHGNVPYEICLSCSARIRKQDPLYEKIETLKQEFAGGELPVILSLKKYRNTGISFEREFKPQLLFYFFQLLTYNGPDVLRLVILAERSWLKEHAWVREIPHVLAKSGIRLIASTLNEAAEVCSALRSESAQILVIALKPALRAALEEISFHTMFLSEGSLPNETDARIILNQGACRLEAEGVQYFEPDPAERFDCWDYLFWLCHYEIDIGSRGPLTTPTFYHLYHSANAAGIPIASNWSRRYVRDGIQGMIGIGDDSDPVILDLHEKGNGPHGLIAGMTGSGKSETS